jgi:hypothetical protein
MSQTAERRSRLTVLRVSILGKVFPVAARIFLASGIWQAMMNSKFAIRNQISLEMAGDGLLTSLYFADKPHDLLPRNEQTPSKVLCKPETLSTS